MPNIIPLDQHTINQIQAGEVIERPAYVVKELLENAIDAGSDSITIEIRGGGIELIRISDNGCGIESTQLPLAFAPHATSKLSSVEDLVHLLSLGFRGEALASIAAIADVEILTKTEQAADGTRYVIEAGTEKVWEKAAVSGGTTILVRNLFKHVPARKKFLKSAQTEATYIEDFVQRIALSHPQISIQFISNQKSKFQTPGNNRLKDVIYLFYGKKISENLHEINYDNLGIQISGYIGSPSIARSNRQAQSFFVNGRYIRDGGIYKAIEEAFSPYVMKHKFPFAVLSLTMQTELVDINAHPSKMEIRFLDHKQVYRAMYHAVKQVLEIKEWIPKMGLGQEEEETQPSSEIVVATKQSQSLKVEEESKSAEDRSLDPTRSILGDLNGENPTGEDVLDIKVGHRVKALQKFLNDISHPHDSIQVKESPDYQVQKNSQPSSIPNFNSLVADESETEPVKKQLRQQSSLLNAIQNHTQEKPDIPIQQSFLSEEEKSKHKIIGQVFSTYCLVQYKDDLMIIDQHAAHEKILYEKMLEVIKTREHTSQQINPAIILTFTVKEEEIYLTYEQYFQEMGFVIEEFGGREYALRAVPDILSDIQKKDLFLEILTNLSEKVLQDEPQLIQETIASLSCKAAVKANKNFTDLEIEHLVQQLFTLKNPYHCPHGRPTIIRMNKIEIEKKFKRK